MDIHAEHLKMIQKILNEHLSLGSSVWLFGSRLEKTHKQFSDIDLAIESSNPLTLSCLATLSHEFSESDLPYKVDIVDLKNTTEALKKNIESGRRLIFKK